jgi:hypothetical protein
MKWKCECGIEYESDSSKRHEIDYCNCGLCAVDLEEEYMRTIGDVKFEFDEDYDEY